MTEGDVPELLIAGRYRLVRRLATSEVDTVWEATDEQVGGPVALHMLEPQSGSTGDHGVVVGRAMRDARPAVRLEHPNAVRVYDVFQHNGEPCLVTELVPWPTLAERLGERGTLPEPEVLTVGAEVASALAAAHAEGIVHGDVTPAHILVADDGTARIRGLGIAHPGTPAYRAPEVTSGEPGYASDVYSLGATLYASLEGAPPSGGAPESAGVLSPLLVRMLAPKANGRPTMAQVADQLGRLAAHSHRRPLAHESVPAAGPAGEPTAALAATRAAGPTASGPRRRVLAVAAILVAVALVVAGIVLVRQRGGSEPAAAPPGQPSSATTSTAGSTPTTSSPTTASGSTTALSPPGPPSADQLADVVTRYYSLVPGNPNEAFGLLTADYQTRVAGGLQAFQRFWSGYSAVAAAEVTGSPPATVTATVTYTTKTGQVTREKTTFGLVDDGGVLKIGSATVTSRS